MNKRQIIAYVTEASRQPSLPPFDPMTIVGHLLADLEQNFRSIPLTTRAAVLATAAILVRHHTQTVDSTTATEDLMASMRCTVTMTASSKKGK